MDPLTDSPYFKLGQAEERIRYLERLLAMVVDSVDLDSAKIAAKLAELGKLGPEKA